MYNQHTDFSTSVKCATAIAIRDRIVELVAKDIYLLGVVVCYIVIIRWISPKASITGYLML